MQRSTARPDAGLAVIEFGWPCDHGVLSDDEAVGVEAGRFQLDLSASSAVVRAPSRFGSVEGRVDPPMAKAPPLRRSTKRQIELFRAADEGLATQPAPQIDGRSRTRARVPRRHPAG